MSTFDCTPKESPWAGAKGFENRAGLIELKTSNSRFSEEKIVFNVCWKCGLYRADKIIDPEGPVAICPECGHRHPFRQLPLLIVSGASGAGKTSVCQHLLGRHSGQILLDSDILWRPEFDKPQDNYRDFFETWLRVCKNIGQAGRPVVLFGAGLGVPENIEPCIERRYFSEIRYLSLVCEDEALAGRLRQRPAWRESGGQEYIDAHLRFNQWFKDRPAQARPQIKLLDTTHTSLAETAAQVREWIRQSERT